METSFRQPTKEEADSLTKDLQEVLKKHNATMGIKAVIELLVEDIPSPFVVNNNGTDNTIEEITKID